MPNFDEKPENMSYAQWLREKNIGIRVKMGIHTDSGLPSEYIDKTKGNELFLLNKSAQGGEILPEDM